MNRDGYSLRPAVAADAPGLATVIEAAYGHYAERAGLPPRPLAADYAAVIEAFNVFVAEVDKVAVALIVLTVDYQGLTINNVAVHPGHRGKGVGKALLRFAEREALTSGLGSVVLHAHEQMTADIALYSRMGYVEYDRRAIGSCTLVYMRKKLPRRR